MPKSAYLVESNFNLRTCVPAYLRTCVPAYLRVG